ncbi:L-lactate MFS transporter [Mycobacterium aquaticum]|uniref:MFS transporter n=1 Tax=Mycobacterium aquaticum TaxID=1927124 RepID=A0A1X0AA80_9MYCO|nr:OFA family MFS transporter [Mycobacterium aquaticum]ORA26934.1 MFS transporter [Mycobacterium aquaticum]
MTRNEWTARSTLDPDAVPAAKRWVILVGAVLVQLALGAVYAWSTFAKAMTSPEAFGWEKAHVAIPFETAIGMIFVGAFIGGRIQDAKGPRTVAMTGGVIYAVGVILASFAHKDTFWVLVLGYGVLAGFGLGMAYIVPIAMLQKWFPDKAGLITGIAVGGFGFGAVITSPLGQVLIDADKTVPTEAFLYLGIAYLIAVLIGASTFANPPTGYRPAGMPAPAQKLVGAADDYTVGEALSTRQWYLLTAILMLAVLSGISVIATAASAASDIAGFSKAGAATLVGVIGLMNGGGRILWAWISDKIGKMPTFATLLAIEGLCLLALPHASSGLAFAIFACVTILCYGGAFGTMPSTAGKFFGVSRAGAIYGLMLVAWSLGGILGPLIANGLIGHDKNYTTAFTVVGCIALAAITLTVITKPPHHAARKQAAVVRPVAPARPPAG